MAGEIEDLHAALQTDSEIEESEYTSNDEALRLLRASGEAAGTRQVHHAYYD